MDSKSLQANGSLIARIGRERPELTRAFGRLADVLLADPSLFMTSSVQEISTAAGVSEPSVVRFCRHYGFNGVPDFRIALAMCLATESAGPSGLFLEPTVADKAIVNRTAKLAIAAEAAQLLARDRSLILDSGSTLQCFAHTLRTMPPRTILTTGLNIVETLWACRQHTVIMPGGIIRFDARALTGRMVEQSLQNMRFDTVYFGADSIDPEEGLSTFNEDEAHQNAAMAEVSKRVVVLVDSTKFRAPGLHRFCGMDRIDTIVTDAGLAPETEESIRQRGVNLLIAKPAAEDR